MQELIIQVPDSLATQLVSVKNRLPEILEHGLDELSPIPNQVYRYVLEFLISNPSAEELMDFGPTPAMQTRINILLDKNRVGTLTAKEEKELDEYSHINHLVTMIKARSLPYLTTKS